MFTYLFNDHIDPLIINIDKSIPQKQLKVCSVIYFLNHHIFA